MSQLQNIYALVRSKINPDSVTELGWVFAGQAANVIFSFLIVKVLSSMGPKEYGTYALVVTIAVFVGMSFFGPLAQGFIRFYYHYLEKSVPILFTGFVYKILIAACIVLFVIAIILFGVSLTINLSEPAVFFLIAGIYIITAKLTEFFNSLLNLIRKRKENAILQGSEKLFTILFFLVLIHFKILELINVFLLLSVVMLAFSITKHIVFQKNLPEEQTVEKTFAINARSEMRLQLFGYMAPFLIWGFSGWLQLNGEKWIINGLLSTYDVGIYAAMMALVNGLVIVPNNIISDFATPIIFKQYADMQNKESVNIGFHYIRLNMLVIFLLTVFSTLFTWLWGRDLIILISSKEYIVYWYLLPFLCLGTGLFLTGQAQTVFGMALNRPNKYLIPKVSIGIFSIILNFIFIKIFGISGVAYTVLTVGLLYVIYIALVNKRIRRAFEPGVS